MGYLSLKMRYIWKRHASFYINKTYKGDLQQCQRIYKGYSHDDNSKYIDNGDNNELSVYINRGIGINIRNLSPEAELEEYK